MAAQLFVLMCHGEMWIICTIPNLAVALETPTSSFFHTQQKFGEGFKLLNFGHLAFSCLFHRDLVSFISNFFISNKASKTSKLLLSNLKASKFEIKQHNIHKSTRGSNDNFGRIKNV